MEWLLKVLAPLEDPLWLVIDDLHELGSDEARWQLELLELAGELSVSTSSVKTHLRNLYAKLGVHSRAEAVERARALGLLAPSAHL